MILRIYIALISLIFSFPNGVQEVDIYQKVLDDLQYDDPRVPHVHAREKLKINAVHKGSGGTVDEVGSTNQENAKLLSECQLKLKLVELENIGYMAKNQGDGIPFFKQFIRRFSEVLRPVDGDLNTLGAKIVLKKEQFDELQSILQKQSNAKEILDLFIQYDVFHPLEHTVSIWGKLLTQLNLPLVITVIVFITFLLLFLVFLKHIFFQEIHWRRSVVFVLFIGFLFSIPWEWYRMYRVALSKKMSVTSQDIPAECNPKDMNVLKSISMFFRHKFTFNDDECAKYHESLLVDPLWEVSPLHATSVVLSRFVFEPMKLFSEALGVSFKLFFKEIPAQWQPFLFIALVIIIVFLIISCSGLRIESPFLKINVNPQHEVRYLQAPGIQNIPPVQAIEQIGNQQERLPVVQMQSNDDGKKEVDVAQNGTAHAHSGVMEVKGEMLLPEAVHAKNSHLLQKENREMNTKYLQNQQVQVLRITNDVASGESTRHVEDITSMLVSKCPSEHQDIQGDGRCISRNLPSESEYHNLEGDLNPGVEDVPALQDESDASSISFLGNRNTVDQIPDIRSLSIADTHPHIDESVGSIVVPHQSSIFSMPLHAEHSTAEISEIRRRRIQDSGENSRISPP